MVTRASESSSLSLWALLYLGNEYNNPLKIVEGINWDNSNCQFPFPLLISQQCFKRKKIEVSWFSSFLALHSMPLHYVSLASCDPPTEHHRRIINHQLGRLDFESCFFFFSFPFFFWELFSKTITWLHKLGIYRQNLVFCKWGYWRLNRMWEDCLSYSWIYLF